MLRVLILSILISSPLTWAFDHNVVKGQWAVYQDNLFSEDYYYFLFISEDYSGALVRALGHEPITRNFGPENIKKQEGYLEIELGENEKAVLSAWKLKSGSGRLTGQVFMYKENGELFNMLHFQLEYLKPNHELLKNEKIKSLSNSFR